LARHVLASHKPPFSVVTVPAVEDEDLRHLGRELKPRNGPRRPTCRNDTYRTY
jgi:hypothetical protein